MSMTADFCRSAERSSFQSTYCFHITSASSAFSCKFGKYVYCIDVICLPRKRFDKSLQLIFVLKLTSSVFYPVSKHTAHRGSSVSQVLYLSSLYSLKVSLTRFSFLLLNFAVSIQAHFLTWLLLWFAILFPESQGSPYHALRTSGAVFYFCTDVVAWYEAVFLSKYLLESVQKASSNAFVFAQETFTKYCRPSKNSIPSVFVTLKWVHFFASGSIFLCNWVVQEIVTT